MLEILEVPGARDTSESKKGSHPSTEAGADVLQQFDQWIADTSILDPLHQQDFL